MPPLDYDLVRQLKKERPSLTVILNGGIETIDEAHSFMDDFDGVMLGRAAYGAPYLLSRVDQEFFGNDASAPSREDVVAHMSSYIKEQFRKGVRPHSVTAAYAWTLSWRAGRARVATVHF